MSKQMPQDHRRSTVESINDDLEILNNMNIDEDFNIVYGMTFVPPLPSRRNASL